MLRSTPLIRKHQTARAFGVDGRDNRHKVSVPIRQKKNEAARAALPIVRSTTFAASFLGGAHCSLRRPAVSSARRHASNWLTAAGKPPH